uniref:Uncharacterized protein n=1 Tax=Spongospora subterranea TaxID=70186 RepID=A0A0H5RUD9_9EUKA|eukprot:CRZ12339.1 hypothetical protein [Spongospora subterranea]
MVVDHTPPPPQTRSQSITAVALQQEQMNHEITGIHTSLHALQQTCERLAARFEDAFQNANAPPTFPPAGTDQQPSKHIKPFPITTTALPTSVIRPVQPPSFSGSERPPIDPQDHLFSLDLWLLDQPEARKIALAAGTLTGTARKEWRIRLRAPIVPDG